VRPQCKLTPDGESSNGSRRAGHVLSHTLIVAGVAEGDVTNDEDRSVMRDGVLVARRQDDWFAAALPAHRRPRLTRHETVKRHSAAARRLGVAWRSVHRRSHYTTLGTPQFTQEKF